jgi:Pyruvate/2-oxoglutarate dehydrogenase complex, dihydrolipoamide dehydrogenase (E3) component, and related enzymes
MRYTVFIVLVLLPQITLRAQNRISADICVYGATSGGVIAAYTAARLGKKVILVEPSAHLGGLSSGGLGNTDIGNKLAITGLARDFYHRVGQHYGKPEQWIFEPHVAEDIFKDYIREARVTVIYRQSILSVFKKGNSIQEIKTSGVDASGEKSGTIIQAREYIDCSYEGDLMARAGVSYTVGRESNQQYHESYNGFQILDKHQFPDKVDPYIIPGKPESGLLWGISSATIATRGSGDKKVQAYNFRLCLTDSIPNQVPITRPDGYDSSHYSLLLRYIQIKNPKSLEDGLLNINAMPGHKTDINNNGPFSTDMIGMNYNYPEAGEKKRMEIIRAHTVYIKGLLYFLGHDDQMPEHLKNEMLQWGYPKDEYPDNDHWTPQLYIREARRMIGSYVMTEANCTGNLKVNDGIGLAAYTMDSHNCQRIVINGMVKNEGDVQVGGFPPYPVSYRSIIPKKVSCTNLLVPVCLSASHIAYGSIRMEPVFMVLGQSAAEAAVLAIDLHLPLQDIPVEKLQKELKEDPLVLHRIKY